MDKKHFFELISDWYAFTSSVFLVSLPTGVILGWILVLDYFGVNEPEWFTILFEHIAILTFIAFLAIGGIYAVRTWNRIRDLLTSPFESDSPDMEPRNVAEPRPTRFTDRKRRRKYRYWFWGIAVHFSSMFSFLVLDGRGYSPSDYTFPWSVPEDFGVFTQEMDTIWVIEGLQRLAGSITLGEGLVLFFVVLTPAGLIGFGVQLHIDDIKAKERWYLLDYVGLIIKSIWAVVAILIVGSM